MSNGHKKTATKPAIPGKNTPGSRITSRSKLMSRLIMFLYFIPTIAWAQVSRVNLFVEDLNGNPITGVDIRPKPGQAESPTDDDGRTSLFIAREVRPGEEIALRMAADAEWVFLTPDYRIRYPETENQPVTVVLVRKGDRDILTSDLAKKAIVQSLLTLIDAGFEVEHRSGDEQRQKMALADVAKNLGLSPETIDAAIRYWEDQGHFELGLAALYDKKFPEAAAQLNKAYNETKSDSEKNKEELAKRAFFLGQALDGQGKYREALPKFQEASELQPSQLYYTQGLALALHKMGRNREAEQYLIKVSSHYKRNLGEEHPDTLTSMSYLAESRKAQGELAGAQALHEEVLQIRERVLGEEHPDTLTSMSYLAESRKARGDLVEARTLERKALAIRQRTLGEEHPDTLTSMNHLSEVLIASGDLVEAQTLEEKVLEARRRTLGVEHPDTLTTMNIMTQNLKAQGKLAEAQSLHEETLRIRRRVLGEEHPDTLTSLVNLINTLADQDKMSEVKELLSSRERNPRLTQSREIVFQLPSPPLKENPESYILNGRPLVGLEFLCEDGQLIALGKPNLLDLFSQGLNQLRVLYKQAEEDVFLWREGNALERYSNSHLGKSYALLITITRYKDGYGPLPELASQSQELKAVLEGHGFEVLHLLDTEKEITMKSFEDAIVALNNRMDPQKDRFFMYYGGHGYPVGENTYLLLHGYDQRPPFFSCLSMSRMYKADSLDFIQAKHILVAVDACYAGQGFSFGQQEKVGNIKNLVDIYRLTSKPGKDIFTAGTGALEVFGKKGVGGFFTQVLIDALKGNADKDRNRMVTIAEIKQYLKENVYYEARREDHIQEPMHFGTDLDGEMVFMLPDPEVVEK